MELTGYKEVWIGATPPTNAHRHHRDRRILVDDLWWDTANNVWKQCSSTTPPTWEEIPLGSIILVSPNGTLYRVGVENNGALTTTPV